MGGGDDAVERQVRANNAHDLDAFVACYAEAVVIEDAARGPLLSGRDEVREQYRRLFTDSPDLYAVVTTQIQVGSYVIDEEQVTGGPRGDVAPLPSTGSMTVG